MCCLYIYSPTYLHTHISSIFFYFGCDSCIIFNAIYYYIYIICTLHIQYNKAALLFHIDPVMMSLPADESCASCFRVMVDPRAPMEVLVKMACVE